MRKIIVTMWITLDGYIAGPNNNMDFVGQFNTEELDQYQNDLVNSADTLILGRLTYESFAGAWPAIAENPDADPAERAYARTLSSMHKVVFSKTLNSADWVNSTLSREINSSEVKALKEQSGKDIVIYGSASVVEQLTRLGLIDQYQLLVHPVFLGNGKPLFKEASTLSLVSSRTYSSGVILLTYQPT